MIKQKHRWISILGSTGSIGQSTLSVIQHNKQHFSVYALVAGVNVKKMFEQCLDVNPKFAVMENADSAQQLKRLIKESGLKTDVLYGQEAACHVVSDSAVDLVMSAIVGAAGLYPTLAAIKAGKCILLANKESLVTCGELFMHEVEKNKAQLLPIDSEHNAIFQSLPQAIQQQLGIAKLTDHGIQKIVLTGSGGPFRELPLSEFSNVTPEQACKHPNWSMGRKISVDSATMMNKGLEYIEARWLFNAPVNMMEIIIHPQSIIHSMVRYIDGSVIAQMGKPDMRTPIAHAMAYPERITSGVDALDFTQITQLTFTHPDFNRYPCLKLAIDAYQQGQAATTALNAANEIAVQRFLSGEITFTQISCLIEILLSKLNFSAPKSIDDVYEIDAWARNQTEKIQL